MPSSHAPDPSPVPSSDPSSLGIPCILKLKKALEWSVVLIVIALTLDVLLGVFSRFVFGYQLPFTDELARALLVWLSLLGSALAFESKAHLGVDFLMLKFDAKVQWLGELFAQLMILFFAGSVLVVGGFVLVQEQWGQALTTIPWMTRGMMYAALPISGVFTILFSAAHVISIWQNRSTYTQSKEIL